MLSNLFFFKNLFIFSYFKENSASCAKLRNIPRAAPTTSCIFFPVLLQVSKHDMLETDGRSCHPLHPLTSCHPSISLLPLPLLFRPPKAGIAVSSAVTSSAAAPATRQGHFRLQTPRTPETTTSPLLHHLL